LIPSAPLYPIFSEEQTSSLFESKLKKLEEMGFVDRNVNIELLVKNNGDVTQVVRDILNA